jgi:hypothetical protein
MIGVGNSRRYGGLALHFRLGEGQEAVASRTVGGSATPAAERGLAHLKRFAAQVVAVQFDQVEGIEEHAAGLLPVRPRIVLTSPCLM